MWSAFTRAPARDTNLKRQKEGRKENARKEKERKGGSVIGDHESN
jgi:hypothetical protein